MLLLDVLTGAKLLCTFLGKIYSKRSMSRSACKSKSQKQISHSGSAKYENAYRFYPLCAQLKLNQYPDHRILVLRTPALLTKFTLKA